MRVCVQNTFLLFSFFTFLFFPFVFSKLSADQNKTMIKISELWDIVSWDITKEPDQCSWNGVRCNPSNSSITQISLSGFSLSNSSFLPVLCQIESLQVVDVSNNFFNSIPDGFITGCGGIEGLKLLNFSKNRLVGFLPDFVGFVKLEFLDLSFNMMSGTIGSRLTGLNNLKSLNLSSNNFTGSFPVNLGKFKVLEQLVLSKNSFQGEVPEDIFSYVNLNLIDISENQLSGSLSDRIGELSNLEVLILSSNNLTGDIPKDLSNIKNLSRFSANQNNFTGTIPTGISSSVKNLDLSYNKLSGYIPSELLLQQNLQTVDLSYNLLVGEIPSEISPSLVRLRLGSNSLNGTIPSMVGKLEKLMYLELENNSLTGFIPQELGFCKNILLLNLAQNKLSGEIPVGLGNLSNLQVMKLQVNKLVGEIPFQITKLHNLSMLNIGWNLLNGSIPPSISSLQNLINLNLQGNNLAGSIPDTISSMKSLLELQLGRNRLRNPIPRMPPNLQIALNLSSNFFEGPIPYTLFLFSLEVLDLSNNKFSNEIPSFLTQMKALTQLTLSNNQLTGVIPNFPPYVVVDKDGNLDLKYATSSNTSSVVTKKKKSVAMPITVAVLAAVFSVGVITAIAVLISRRYYKVNDIESRSREDVPVPLVIQGNLLTDNIIHRSNIDFPKAMGAVSSSSNIVLKTRFSTYYQAIMPSGSSYYVKKLNWSEKVFQSINRDKFRQELEVLAKLSNSNVLNPLAYVSTLDSAYLFYEFAPKGTLFNVLHGGSLGSVLDWASRYSIAVGVAQGLAFLHGHSFGSLLLLDLSSKNIFLKSLKEPQIGDIELCKVIDPSKSTRSLSTVAGSVGYIPPEYAYTMRITTAGNIYSYGVILLELLTGKPAVCEGTELAKLVLSNSVQQRKWDYILDTSVRRTSLAVRSQMLEVLKVALACVSMSPEARPKIKSVLRMLINAR